MIAQKQTQEMEQIGDAVMDRRGGHQQHATPDDEAGERPVAVRVGVPEAVGFIDDDGRSAGRTGETLRDSCVMMGISCTANRSNNVRH